MPRFRFGGVVLGVLEELDAGHAAHRVKQLDTKC
jgi:hypothetical protein